MTDREFNLPNILAANTAQFLRVTPKAVYYYLWVLDSNEPLAHRGPMRAFEFSVLPEQLTQLGELRAGMPAATLEPSIAAAIKNGTFRQTQP